MRSRDRLLGFVLLIALGTACSQQTLHRAGPQAVHEQAWSRVESVSKRAAVSRAVQSAEPLSPSRLARLQLSENAVKLGKNTYARCVTASHQPMMAVEQVVFAPVLTFEQLMQLDSLGVINDDSKVLLINCRATLPGTPGVIFTAVHDSSSSIPWYKTVWGQGDPLDDRIPPPSDANASCSVPEPGPAASADATMASP
jgi:hypothetical protein